MQSPIQRHAELAVIKQSKSRANNTVQRYAHDIAEFKSFIYLYKQNGEVVKQTNAIL